MYVIKLDGELLYSPELTDDGYKVISPKLHLEVNRSGSLEFTLPPCNVKYDTVHKMKSIVTVEQDGETLFRGRVIKENVDIYRQKEIYCEGDLNFLLDSVQEPLDNTGTPRILFMQLISYHNNQVDDDKEFLWGDCSGLTDLPATDFKTTTYADTLSTIKSLLLDEYGGYIRTRYEDAQPLLDYIKEYTHECTQKIELGVNLLDMDSQTDATDLCTVLIPLGAAVNESPLTVADANNGSIYIENADLIKKYGRIVKTHTFEEIEDAAELLTAGQKYMQEMVLGETLKLKAVDMHVCDADVEAIRLGDKVRFVSKPHGIDRMDICTEIDLDLENPDESEYTFGKPAETLTGNSASVASKVSHQHRWLTETDEALNIAVENINLIGHKTTTIEADFNAAKAEIALKANQESVDVLGESLSGAEVRIDGAEAAIELKAAQATVDEMGERLTTAEVRIDGMDSTITAKADKVRVEALETEIAGLLKADELEAEIASLGDLHVGGDVNVPGAITADSMWVNGVATLEGGIDAGGIDCTGLTINGNTAATQSWVNGRGFLTELPSNAATQAWVLKQGYATTSVTNALDARIKALEAK